MLVRNISSGSSTANNLGSKEALSVRDDTQNIEDDRLQAYQPACSSEAWEAALSGGDGLAAGLSGGCTTVCTSSTVSGLDTPCRTSFDSMRPHLPGLHTPVAAAQGMMQPECSQQLLLGTAAGVFQLDLSTQQVQQLALASVPVAFVCYSSCGLLLAACPVPDEAHYGNPDSRAAAKEAAGLYCINLKQHGSSCSSSSFGMPAIKLWDGGAT